MLVKSFSMQIRIREVLQRCCCWRACLSMDSRGYCWPPSFLIRTSHHPFSRSFQACVHACAKQAKSARIHCGVSSGTHIWRMLTLMVVLAKLIMVNCKYFEIRFAKLLEQLGEECLWLLLHVGWAQPWAQPLHACVLEFFSAYRPRMLEQCWEQKRSPSNRCSMEFMAHSPGTLG